MLDTNIVSELIRNPRGPVMKRIEREGNFSASAAGLRLPFGTSMKYPADLARDRMRPPEFLSSGFQAGTRGRLFHLAAQRHPLRHGLRARDRPGLSKPGHDRPTGHVAIRYLRHAGRVQVRGPRRCGPFRRGGPKPRRKGIANRSSMAAETKKVREQARRYGDSLDRPAGRSTTKKYKNLIYP